MEAKFNEVPFAEGRFRTAYMGTWTKPRKKKGKKCVIKEKKETYAWRSTDWDTAMTIQKKAAELASGFNSFSSCRRKITFTDVALMVVSKRLNPKSHPMVNEYVILEEYIPGAFKKWCNNYGFISDESASVALAMPAFMHWSWVESKGELMIADLQGVCTDKRYILTDPVILSTSNEYGITDMGIEGMAMFFMHHKCNSLCEQLPRPTTTDFVGKIPMEVLLSCYQMLEQVGATTSYLHELQFTTHIRSVVSRTMRAIAERGFQ